MQRGEPELRAADQDGAARGACAISSSGGGSAGRTIAAARGAAGSELMFGPWEIVMAGLDPAIPLSKARPYHMIGIAGSSPAMTTDMLNLIRTR